MASKIQVDKISRNSGTPEFTIPTADGSAGQFLKTDGSGVLSFDSVTTTALTGSTNTWIPTITGANALTGTANFTYDGNTLDVKNGGTASSIKLYCESSNAHYQAIKAAPHSGSSDWTLTLPSTVPSVSGQALTATTAGVSSWTTLPAGGLTDCSQWRINTNFSMGGQNVKYYVTSGWEENDSTGYTRLGSAMTESSGVFTFPSTGFWIIRWWMTTQCSNNSAYTRAYIDVTINNSTYTSIAVGEANNASTTYWCTPATETLFDVTSTTDCKVKVAGFTAGGNAQIQGFSDINSAYITFSKLAAT